MPILPLLGLIFVTLRLCEVITWSWWWVTAPFWGGLALALVVLALAALGMAGGLGFPKQVHPVPPGANVNPLN